MSKTKSIGDYSADILQLHELLKELPPQHPDYEKIKAKLSRQLTAWANKLSIVVSVASNEQSPWLDKEIGYSCIPMPTQKASGVHQVADYQAYLNDYDMFCGILVERKGVTRKNGRMVGCDLYSSFANTDNRQRFYAEIMRYKNDTRFNQMILIAECTLGEYLSFKPAFNGKHYNITNPGMNVSARWATVAKLSVTECPIFFAGTRQHAVRVYHDVIIQWCRANYTTILNIEE